MTSAQEIAQSLSEYERLVLPVLKTTLDSTQIKSLTKLDDVQLSRAFQWLSNKQLITLEYKKEEYLALDTNGLAYKEKGFPEKAFLEVLLDNKPHTLSNITYESELSDQEVSVSLGLLKSKGAITTDKSDQGMVCIITPQGKEFLAQKTPEELFLQTSFPIKKEELTAEQSKIVELLLRRRNILTTERKQIPLITLTDFGREVASMDLAAAVAVNALTIDMLKSGEWKNAKFRPFDVTSQVPVIHPGRIHPMTAVIRLVKSIFVEMGFSEMIGPWVETSFWCMDSMWIPQDHPARDVQDTFFLNKKGKLPDAQLVKKVADAHEHGANTGSTGYGYTWDPKKAQELILRTHTTATTYRTLAAGVPNPSKFFYVGKVFRNEAIDATHLPEFYQVEGFVVADNLTLSDLLGFIKEFYAKLGFHQIKFKVTYNPYTEPSVEAAYFDEKRGKWMELINSGIFRPESLAPYGINKPVIAWGMGLERLAMILLEQGKLKDIIGPVSDLAWLRDYKMVVR